VEAPAPMKVKQRSDDFRVRELLAPEVLQPRGEFRVYRVIKSKLTSLDAARALAYEAHASAGDVSMCGLKDRQGVTVQHMALRHGPQISVRSPDLRIETAGFVSEPLDSKASEGNAFEITLRGLTAPDVEPLRVNAHAVRERGVMNYFDEQRFGNLRHGQGWIALDLMRGLHESALRALLTSRSPFDDHKAKAFKRALTSYWGDWSVCRDIAGKFGEHHSLFEHLKREPQDFGGAFYHLSSRLRLIHLYSYQSHLWNRAVAEFVRARTQPNQRVVLRSAEGPLVYPEIDVDLGVGPDAMFRLPGPKLADVEDREQFDLLADALAHDRLVPAQFVIEGVSGFQIKGEDRPLCVTPRHLRLRPARADALNPGAMSVEVRFELPRGAYATLVVKRLLESSNSHSQVMPPRALSPKPPRRVSPEDERTRRTIQSGDVPLEERRPPSRRGERRPPYGDRGRDDRRGPGDDRRHDDRSYAPRSYGDRRDDGSRGEPRRYDDRRPDARRFDDRPRYDDRGPIRDRGAYDNRGDARRDRPYSGGSRDRDDRAFRPGRSTPPYGARDDRWAPPRRDERPSGADDRRGRGGPPRGGRGDGPGGRRPPPNRSGGSRPYGGPRKPRPRSDGDSNR